MMGAAYRTLSRLGLVRRWDQWLLSLFTGWGPGWPRDCLIFVTGFHHTGTTLMQSQLHRQGVFAFFREARDGSPELPREMSLSYLHRLEHAARRADRRWFMTKLPSNSAGFVRRMGVDLRLLAPDCTVVVCRRDPAATALSLSKRYGWDPARARADAATQQRVLDGWRAIARRHRGPVHFVSLRGFLAKSNAVLATDSASWRRAAARSRGNGCRGPRRAPLTSHRGGTPGYAGTPSAAASAEPSAGLSGRPGWLDGDGKRRGSRRAAGDSRALRHLAFRIRGRRTPWPDRGPRTLIARDGRARARYSEPADGRGATVSHPMTGDPAAHSVAPCRESLATGREGDGVSRQITAFGTF